MTVTRYHLTLTNQIDHYGDSTVISGTILADGTFRALVDFKNADIEWIEECMDVDENVIAYSLETLEPTAGRPISLPGSVGELARAVGGVQVLCDLLGGVAPSTVRRWANGEVQPARTARVMLDRLFDEHGIIRG